MTLKISSDNIQSSGVSAGSYPNANVTVNTSGIITSIASGIVAGAGTFFTYTYTGDGTTTTFSGGSNMTVHNVIVAENGVVQYPTTDYTVSSTNIVFTSAPASGVLIQIRILAGGTLTPKITNITVTDSNYNNLDDTAVNTSGGYIKITGTDFFTGCQVVVGAVVATSVTFISNTEVRAQVPAQSAGTYTVYLTNSDGGVAIRVNGLNYSATPTWTTTSPLPSGFKNSPISLQLSATSNSSVTYSLQSGSTLPSGLTLSSSGLLSGTVTSISAETTYNFTVIATDGEAQDTPQAFQITIIISDLYYPLVTLHLPGNGTNLANNNTFLDSSTNNFTITRNPATGPNAPTQGTFSPFSQTGWSNYFDGTDDRLSVPDDAKYYIGSSDFTIECWIYNTAYEGGGQNMIFEKGPFTTAKCYRVLVDATSIMFQINFSGSGSGSYTSFSATGLTNNLNQWYHIAFVRNGSSFYIFRNGVQVGSTGSISGTTFNSSTPLIIGGAADGNNNYMMNGYISNFRIITGQAVATSTFTPPTSPLTTSTTGWVVGGSAVALTGTVGLLTCQSNRFLDTSASPLSITVGAGTPTVVPFSPFNPTSAWSASTVGGSGYFDGTGDYLSVADNAALDLGNSNFTIEGWFYMPSAPSSSQIVGLVSKWGASGQRSWSVYFYNAGGTYQIYLTYTTDGSTNQNLYNQGFVFPAGQWAHIAVVRSTTTVKFYINGSVAGTGSENISTNTVFDSTSSVAIASETSTGANYLTGYTSSIRIVKGTAVYTGAFTPPSLAPLTTAGSTSAASYPSTTNVNTSFASSATSLLLNFTNAGIYDATAKNVLETVGDAQVSNAVTPKWGSTSIKFDGTGDYLTSLNSTLYQFGTGDFAIEGWIYINSLSAAIALIDFRSANGATFGQIYITTGGVLRFYLPTDIGTSNSFSTGAWTFFAIARTAGTLNMYIGANRGYTGTYTSAMDGGALKIGADVNGGSGLNGYLQDLRFTKGYGRGYTGATITVPTAAFAQQ